MLKPYPLPDPRKRPDSFLTILYKTLKRIEYDDRAWDKEYFARCNKRTAQLLENLGGDVQAAAKCMQDLKEQFEGDGISWTIETICQYSFEWKASQEKKTDRDTLRRFIGEMGKAARIGDLQRVDMNTLIGKIKALPAGSAEGGPSEFIGEQKSLVSGDE